MPSSPRTALAERLRAELRASGVSQASLAEQVGVSQQTVSKWLTAETQPRPKLLGALARALGMDVNELSAALVADDADPPSPDRLTEMRVAALDRRIRDLSPDQLSRLEAYVRGLLDGRS
ncbi:MAG TPA: helix-turn-helix transcriptional regulator [Acidimicrobiales bacterium]|nr:helix-turn-helix transcriptional regulator [Acidimicrobiales bacterium]